MGGQLSGEKLYEGVRFNVIRVTRRLVGVNFPSKNIQLEWPLSIIWHLQSRSELTEVGIAYRPLTSRFLYDDIVKRSL